MQNVVHGSHTDLKDACQFTKAAAVVLSDELAQFVLVACCPGKLGSADMGPVEAACAWIDGEVPGPISHSCLTQSEWPMHALQVLPDADWADILGS